MPWHILEATLCGGSGLVVMGCDSQTEGRGFKSQHRILDGDLFHINLFAKIEWTFVWKRPKINLKEVGDAVTHAWSNFVWAQTCLFLLLERCQGRLLRMPKKEREINLGKKLNFLIIDCGDQTKSRSGLKKSCFSTLKIGSARLGLFYLLLSFDNNPFGRKVI